MVIAGKVSKVAFYCRMNHRDRNYSQFMNEVQNSLDERFGASGWEMNLYFEVASGADPNRKKFNLLKAEIAAGNVDAVITMKADTLARDWKQFMEFMELCEKQNVEVICIRQSPSPMEIYKRINQFTEAIFEGSERS